jgi:hypothetical protein
MARQRYDIGSKEVVALFRKFGRGGAINEVYRHLATQNFLQNRWWSTTRSLVPAAWPMISN